MNTIIYTPIKGKKVEIDVPEIDRIVAKEERRRLGGVPKMRMCWDADENKYIAMYTSVDKSKNVQMCGTVGLNAVNIGKRTADNKLLRTEIWGICDIEIEDFTNIIATTAEEIRNFQICFPGHVVQNVIPLYIKDGDMKHMLLTYPFSWDNTESITVDNICIAWLQAMPISEMEYRFLKAYGLDALEDIFEEEDVAYWDIYRESLI